MTRRSPKQTLVLRSKTQGEPLAAALRTHGIPVNHVPLTRITPIRPAPETTLAWAKYYAAIFTSANGVEHFFASRALSGQPAYVVAIGPRTTEALTKQGMVDVRVATPHTSEGVVKLLSKLTAAPRPLPDAPILLPGALVTRGVIANGATELGLRVESVAVYKNLGPTDEARAELRGLRPETVQVIIATAPSQLEILHDVVADGLATIPTVVIGETTAACARALGRKNVIVAKKPSDAALVSCALSYYES